MRKRIDDIGPAPHAFDIEAATRDNEEFRRVVWTGKLLQVVLMSIPVGGAIGLEVHHDTDQFIRVDAGEGLALMGPGRDQLDSQHEISDGWSVQIPAGTWHDIRNTGERPLQLSTVYAPPHHAAGRVHASAAEAAEDEAAGNDDPPRWTSGE